MHQVTKLSISELRQQWQKHWNRPVPARISRGMLEKSLSYKLEQLNGNGLNKNDQAMLDRLIKNYRRNPNYFEKEQMPQSIGTRLVRKWQGVEHEVMVTDKGYQYRNTNYESLSKLAFVITGTRWNGLVFFGLKKRTEPKSKKVVQ